MYCKQIYTCLFIRHSAMPVAFSCQRINCGQTGRMEDPSYFSIPLLRLCSSADSCWWIPAKLHLDFFHCFVALSCFFSTFFLPPHRPPHTPQCDTNCPIRHVAPRANAAVMSLRLLQLSRPKLTHPDFQGNREVRSCCTQTQRAHTASRESNLSIEFDQLIHF